MADDTDPTAESPAEPARERATSGVHIPAWLAAALIVVLALAVGGTGYAIGNSGGGDSSRDSTVDPIANVRRPNLPDGGPLTQRGEQGQHRPGGSCDQRGNRSGNRGDQSGNGGDPTDNQNGNGPPGPLGPVGNNNGQSNGL